MIAFLFREEPITRSVHQYNQIADAIKRDTVAADLITIPDCACSPEKEYADGTKPEYYTNPKKAAHAWAAHAIYNRRYWGVHYKGVHVLNVRTHYILNAMGGLVSLTRQPNKE